MITIFALPRPFEGHFNTIQRNAIVSWTKLRPKCEIILAGPEPGTAEISKELGLKHISELKTNEFGTFLLNDIFDKVKQVASFDILAKVNADNILLGDFSDAVRVLTKFHKNRFLLVGQRWDMDIKEEISFDNPEWESNLRERLKREGKLHGLSGMDYWVFSKDVDFKVPSFTEGRFTTDGWLVGQAKSLGIPVIDGTPLITLIHENHHYPQMEREFYETERKRNIELAGGLSKILTLRDADWMLSKEGLRKPSFKRGIYAKLSLIPAWRKILYVKRKIFNRI